ncbi:MAG: hypothetical protein LBE24_07945 [Methylobacillus sp.]|jgi:hypothetical protein|nr:hypothetical protein [Methylobacillus sp.]
MINIVNDLNEAIADFVQRPENRALLPLTGTESTPFRGSLFGLTRADDVHRALETRRAAILLLAANPYSKVPLDEIQTASFDDGGWMDFKRQCNSGSFGERYESGEMWDPIHNPHVGQRRISWEFLANSIQAALGSLDEVALANVFSWASKDINDLFQYLNKHSLTDRVLRFADEQVRAILKALRPRLILCFKSAAKPSCLSSAMNTEARDVSPVGMKGKRPFKIQLGRYVNSESAYSV